MTTNIFFTAAATSDLAERVQEAVRSASGSRSPERIAHLEEVMRRAEELNQKGILRRREYTESSSADLRKRYLSQAS